MFIILGKENADAVREKHTVLELETRDGVTAYCVVPAEAMSIGDITDTIKMCEFHRAFISNWNKGAYEAAKHIAEHLLGKFGGELDSFYTYMLDRIKEIEGATNKDQ